MEEKKARLLMDRSVPGRRGARLPALDVPPAELPPAQYLREEVPLPELSEPEVVRYFTRLSQKNFAVDTTFYPLGSCTMKYNPKFHDEVAGWPSFSQLHPLQPEETVQGALQVLYELQELIARITGMEAVSLAPLAGSHGELAGMLMVRAYFRDRGEGERQVVLVPDSAHGTNPASAAMAGFQVVTVPSDRNGDLDLEALREALGPHVAALMLTMPTTLGLFDPHILEITELVHRAGALVYGDGANLNALLGKVRFADLGFDLVHLNVHKTFSTPHGGGGPGAGPLAARGPLTAYLPSPVVQYEEEKGFRWSAPARTIGPLGAFHGNFGVLLRAYMYIRSLGEDGLREVSETAVLHANYLRARLREHYHLPYDRTCLHEVVFSAVRQRDRCGVRALDIAKRLMDYGFHPPIVYFPLVVEEAMMIEPTETESVETLDAFIAAMAAIAREAEERPELVRNAPYTTPVRRLDEARAARRLDLRWRPDQDS